MVSELPKTGTASSYPPIYPKGPNNSPPTLFQPLEKPETEKHNSSGAKKRTSDSAELEKPPSEAMSRFEEGEILLEQVKKRMANAPELEKPSPEAVTHFEQGKVLLEQGDYDRATGAFMRALIICPTYKSANSLLEVCFQKNRERILANLFSSSQNVENNNSPTSPENPAQAAKQDLQPSFFLYLKEAQAGDSKAQCKVGECYYTGKEIAQDYKEAVKWFRKAAEQNDADAQNRLGICYYVGNGVTQNYKEAVKWFLKAADKGDLISMFHVGLCYMEGLGTDRDEKEAFKWFQKAKDLPSAQYALGNCYSGGLGVIQDPKEAITWLQKAANAGFAPAQSRLGNYYEVMGNHNEAFKWYQKAALQGDADGCCFLGLCYLKGHGVALNIQEAFKWILLAAKKDHKEAKNFISLLQMSDSAELEKPPSEAMSRFEEGEILLEQAKKRMANAPELEKPSPEAVTHFEQGKVLLEQGDYRRATVAFMRALSICPTYKSAEDLPAAQYALGKCYTHGLGVNRDEKEAFTCLQKAANAGFAPAQTDLGLLYGVMGNHDVEAFTWIQKAAQQGDVLAFKILSDSYFKGIGVPKDSKEGFKWLLKAAEAADNKDLTSKYDVGICYMEGLGTDRDEKEAFKWFQKAKDLPSAQYALEKCYAKGLGVIQDPKEAFIWLQKAANAGFAPAQTDLGLHYGAIENHNEAFIWLQKAALEGDADGCYCLAKCYLEGKGVALNIQEAGKWILQAADKGHKRALTLLSELL